MGVAPKSSIYILIPEPSKVHYFLNYVDFLPICPIWTVWEKIERFQQKLNGNVATNMSHLPRATVSFFLAVRGHFQSWLEPFKIAMQQQALTVQM